MNICFVCNEYPPALHGGIGSFTKTMGLMLTDRGHRIHVIGAYAGLDAECTEVQDGVRVTRLPRLSGSGGTFRTRMTIFQQIARWCRRGEVDIVEVPDFEGWSAGWPQLPVPVVMRLHGSATYFLDEMQQPPRPLLQWIEGSAFLHADAHLASSLYVDHRTRQLFRYNRPAQTIVYNGVEVPEILPSGRREPRLVVFSGTLTRKKGVFSLVDAWRRVSGQIRGAELHLFGKDTSALNMPSIRKQLENAAGEAADSIVFHGHVPLATLQHFYRKATAAVFPSYAEAFAIAPLEAMAQACPTIYSDRSSGPELIDHGVNGFLVNPEDPDVIASAILRLITRPADAAAIGAEGWRTIRRRFDIHELCLRNETEFRRILEHTTSQKLRKIG